MKSFLTILLLGFLAWIVLGSDAPATRQHTQPQPAMHRVDHPNCGVDEDGYRPESFCPENDREPVGV